MRCCSSELGGPGLGSGLKRRNVCVKGLLKVCYLKGSFRVHLGCVVLGRTFRFCFHPGYVCCCCQSGTNLRHRQIRRPIGSESNCWRTTTRNLHFARQGFREQGAANKFHHALVTRGSVIDLTVSGPGLGGGHGWLCSTRGTGF